MAVPTAGCQSPLVGGVTANARTCGTHQSTSGDPLGQQRAPGVACAREDDHHPAVVTTHDQLAGNEDLLDIRPPVEHASPASGAWERQHLAVAYGVDIRSQVHGPAWRPAGPAPEKLAGRDPERLDAPVVE